MLGFGWLMALVRLFGVFLRGSRGSVGCGLMVGGGVVTNGLGSATFLGNEPLLDGWTPEPVLVSGSDIDGWSKSQTIA